MARGWGAVPEAEKAPDTRSSIGVTGDPQRRWRAGCAGAGPRPGRSCAAVVLGLLAAGVVALPSDGR